ncbi:MAG: hypothetical protein IPO64_05220 [Bacteroidetes bacterium]|nr:hypothetical protein [Bacteroidota bacterium]
MFLKDKIESIVDDLKLDLKGKVVLTEAATGAYVVTPIIAAVAGAKVFAYTQNTRYGTIEDVKKQTIDLTSSFNNLDIKIIDELTPEILNSADIITNSGHLRPINIEKLKHLKKNVVIPYMFEAWEFRDEDLDLKYCKENNIKVAATNERHPDIDVFNYLGELTVKLIHEAGKCLYKNDFIIISNNDFGYHIAKTLVKLCNKVSVIDLKKNRNKYPEEINWISNFPDITLDKNHQNTEAIIFTAYPFDDTWIKENGIISEDKFNAIYNPLILRFAGHIDTDYLDTHKIAYYPKNVKSGHMGILLSDIGNDSVIRLQAGGLKVGQLLLENNLIYKNIAIAELL